MADDSNLMETEYQPEQKRVKITNNENDKTNQSFLFRDFTLKEELLKAISDVGFEHPSKVLQDCIPQILLGSDILCQANFGIGRTAVFVLATLQKLDPTEDQVLVLVLCHTREIAMQVSQEYKKFAKYMPNVNILSSIGGFSLQAQMKSLQEKCPHIVIGTLGRIIDLIRSKSLNLCHLRYFVLDACDIMVNNLNLRTDVQEIFCSTPRQKQVMMFCSTLTEKTRSICKKFMRNPIEISADDETRLALQDLQQERIHLHENEKNKTLVDLLRHSKFKQAIIFVETSTRCDTLSSLLREQYFPVSRIHGSMPQSERLSTCSKFRDMKTKILVATDLFVRGIDSQEADLVINYDIPYTSSYYLQRVSCAGTKKIAAITFISSARDARIIKEVEQRFGINIPEKTQNLPAIKEN